MEDDTKKSLTVSQLKNRLEELLTVDIIYRDGSPISGPSYYTIHGHLNHLLGKVSSLAMLDSAREELTEALERHGSN